MSRAILRSVFVTFFMIIGLFLLSPGAYAQGDDQDDTSAPSAGNVDNYFCDTRYSQKIDDKESERRSSCQKGYDGESCGEASENDEDGVYAACVAGAEAEKPLPEELDDESLEEIKNMATDPPTLNNESIAGGLRCGSVDTAYIACPTRNIGGIEGSPVWILLNVILNILVTLVGVVAVGGLVYAGMMYSSAGDNQDRVKKAKTLMVNITIGLVVFAAMYILLQFIIPGGIF